MPPVAGDIVLYRPPLDATPDAQYWVPAIVQVTHEDWVPGYHDADGNWVPTARVPQPQKGRVHLLWWGVGDAAQTTTGALDVAEGDGPGCFKQRN